MLVFAGSQVDALAEMYTRAHGVWAAGTRAQQLAQTLDPVARRQLEGVLLDQLVQSTFATPAAEVPPLH